MTTTIERLPDTPKPRRLVETVLDSMALTERPYHQMNYAMPIVVRLVERVREAIDPGDRVLLIGGSSLLAESLISLSADLEIWQFPEAATSDASAARITRTVSPSTLAEMEFPRSAYSAVVLPFVVESMQGDVSALLRRARMALLPRGVLLLCTRNATALPARAAAVMGKHRAVRTAGNPHALGWPGLPVLQEIHRDELTQCASRAGLRVTRCDYLTANRPFLELESLTFEAYAARKALEAVRFAAPRMRDTLLLEMVPRAPADETWQHADDPSVAVIVATGASIERVKTLLEALAEQTYRSDRLEIALLCRDTLPDIGDVVAQARARCDIPVHVLHVSDPDAPDARNWAMSRLRADISAHTDDSCLPPRDWIEAAVRYVDDDVAVVSGPVFALGGSHPHYMEVPGVRPEPMDGKVWRDDLFPIANVFYRTAAALAAGGFASERANGIGWDTELAWRLQRSGWQSRFREGVPQFRCFPAPVEGWRRSQFRAALQLPAMYAAVPEIGGRLTAGVFASRDTLYFDLAVAGAAAAALRRNPRWLLAMLPFTSVLSRRFDFWPPRGWRPSTKFAAKIVVLHAIWLAGLILGSLKSRRPVL